MKAKRIDEYCKHGCYFAGKLVVVDYTEEMKSHPRFGQFGAETSLDALKAARQYVKEHYGEPEEVLLAMPELVCRLK